MYKLATSIDLLIRCPLDLVKALDRCYDTFEAIRESQGWTRRDATGLGLRLNLNPTTLLIDVQLMKINTVHPYFAHVGSICNHQYDRQGSRTALGKVYVMVLKKRGSLGSLDARGAPVERWLAVSVQLK